jgi:cytochrome P450
MILSLVVAAITFFPFHTVIHFHCKLRTQTHHRGQKMPHKRPPMPPKDRFWGPITGHALQIRADRLGFIHRSMLELGDFVEMWVGPRRTFVITDPDAVEWVMKTNAKNYPKNTPGYKKVSEVIGDGVFTEVGESWRNIRKVVQPFFNPRNFSRYQQIVHDECEQALQEIHRGLGGEINFSLIALNYTLRVLGQSMFTQDLGRFTDVVNREFAILVDLTEKRLTRILPFPTPTRRREDREFLASLKEIDQVILDVINNSKAQPRDPEKNFIHAFLEADENVSERFLIDQVKTMVFAGHETSANVLTWIGHYLVTYPEWADQLREEIALQFGESDIDLSQIERLPKLSMFVRECMRLRPPAWSFGRIALEADEIMGHAIVPGDLMTISPFLVHHHPKLWENPEHFDPLRFSADQIKTRHPFAYFPFGGGPRVCIGSGLAMLEIVGFAAKLLQRFDFKLVPGGELTLNPMISLRPDKDLIVRCLSRRQA